MDESGIDGVTFEEVARRAKASKATLYRRWKTKADMVVAAIKAGPASTSSGAIPNTGTLRGDLLELLQRLNSTMQAGHGLSLTILEAGLHDPELCEHIERSMGPTGARLPREVVEAAIERDELPASACTFAYEEVAAATLILRNLNGLTTDLQYLETLVDAVLLPTLLAGVSTGEAGIFSGHPRAASQRDTKEHTDD